jgi:hypothetical protein
MIINTDTIIKIIAVVVKSIDTSIALITMSGGLWSDDFTGWTDE